MFFFEKKCKANYLTCENKNQEKKDDDKQGTTRLKRIPKEKQSYGKKKKQTRFRRLSLLWYWCHCSCCWQRWLSEITHAIQDRPTTSFKPWPTAYTNTPVKYTTSVRPYSRYVCLFFVISLPFAFSAAASRFIWIFMLKRFCFLWPSFVRLICAYEWLKPTKEQVLNRKRTSERKSKRESACFLSHIDLGACAKKGVNLILTMWAMPLKLKQKKYGQKYLL